MRGLWQIAQDWDRATDGEIEYFKQWFHEQTKSPGEPSDLRMACSKGTWQEGNVMDVCVKEPKKLHFVLIKDDNKLEVMYFNTKCPFKRCET
jgi:hypothetical protein